MKRLLALVPLALFAACGGGPTVPDSSVPSFKGAYVFVLTPSPNCSSAIGATTVSLASDEALTSDGRDVVATLPGGNDAAEVSFLHGVAPSPSQVLGGHFVAENYLLPSGSMLVASVWIEGSVASVSGGRGKASGTGTGTIELARGETTASCSGIHAWSLDPR